MRPAWVFQPPPAVRPRVEPRPCQAEADRWARLLAERGPDGLLGQVERDAAAWRSWAAEAARRGQDANAHAMRRNADELLARFGAWASAG